MPRIASLPVCAVCGTKVRSMHHQVDPSDGSHIFDVSCHGSKDRVIIEANDIDEWGPDAVINGGKAFEHEVKGQLVDETV